MMLAALLLQINNLFRGKGAKAVGYENLEKHVKIVAKQLNTVDEEYPQPYFQGTSAKRRFISLEAMRKVLFDMASSLGRSKDFPADPFALDQPLLWLHRDCIEGHFIDKKSWLVQDWMLTSAQRAAYKIADDKRKQASDELLGIAQPPSF